MIFARLFRSKKKNKTTIKENLTYSFEYNGYKYYEFPLRTDIPIHRLLRISEYARWISRGIDKDNLIELINIADELLYNGLKEGKNAAKLGYVLTEIKERESKAVPSEAYYNYFASIYIREDEDLDIFNEQIHLEKVSDFKNASFDGSSFFFQLKELKELTNYSNISLVNFRQALNESHKESKRIKRMRSILQQIK